MITKDKKRHFLIAAVVGVIVFLIAPRILLPAAFALLGLGIVGFEIWQGCTGTGMFEWGDIAAGFLGLVAAVFAAMMLYDKKK